MAKRTKKKKTDRRVMNGSEALFTLFGFLTTRSQPLILSASHDAAPVAEIINQFIKFHKLPATREGMIKPTNIPDTNHMTNSQSKAMQIAEPETVLKAISEELYKLQPKEQNKVIGKILQDFKLLRVQKHAHNDRLQKVYMTEEADSYAELSELNNIISGNYSVL